MSNKVFWEEWNKSGGPRYPHEKVIQFLFRNYKTDRDKLTALDLGSGGGVHTEFLLKEGLTVHAVDISSNGIEITREKLKNAGLQAANLSVGSIHEIEYEPEFFDLVISIGVLDCAGLTISTEALNKAYTALKPGGKLFAVFACKGDYRESVLKDAGFLTYSSDNLDNLLSQPWSEVMRDIYSTTYNNKEYMQMDHIITAIK